MNSLHTNGQLGVPVKVMVIDVESPPEAISHLRADGECYRELWALIREGGCPIGLIQLPFADEPLTRGRLEAGVSGILRGALTQIGHNDGSKELPPASIVIPTAMRRLVGLQSTLASLLRLDYPNFEVIVVNNSREAGDELPPFLVGGDDRVRVVRERRIGISAARNAGVAAAEGDFVAFTDDDVVVDRGWLRAFGSRLVSRLDEAGVTGFILPGDLETEAQLLMERHAGSFWPRLIEPVTRRLLGSETRQGTRQALVGEFGEDGALRRTFSLYAAGTFGAGANMAFRTSALRDAGPFDPALGAGTRTGGGEDLEMMVRLVWRGASLGYEPTAIVQHSHRAEDDALVQQLASWGTGFSAMLVSLILNDPAHLGAIARTMPHAAAERWRAKLRRDADARGASLEETESRRQLARHELSGLLRGPLTYFESRRATRMWRPSA